MTSSIRSGSVEGRNDPSSDGRLPVSSDGRKSPSSDGRSFISEMGEMDRCMDPPGEPCRGAILNYRYQQVMLSACQ